MRYNGFLDCLVKSIQNAGVGVLFRGTGITVLRAFPVNAITFLFYVKIMQYMDAINPRRPRGKEDETQPLTTAVKEKPKTSAKDAQNRTIEKPKISEDVPKKDTDTTEDSTEKTRESAV